MTDKDVVKRDKHITREIHKLFWRANTVRPVLFCLTFAMRIPAQIAYLVIIPVVSALALQAIIDRQFDKVGTYAVWIMLLALSYCVMWSIAGYAISKQAIAGSKYVQNTIFRNFMNKDYDFYTNAYFGSLGAQAARIRDSFNLYGELVTLHVPKQAVILIAGLIIIGYGSLILAAATFVLILMILSFTLLTSSWRLKFRRLTSQASSEVAGSIGDSLSHGTTVKSFAMEDYEEELLQVSLSKWAKEQFKAWITYLPADSGRMMLAALATVVLLLISSKLYQDDTISIAVVILVQLYVIRLVASTTEIADIVKRLEEAMGNAYEPVKTMGIPVHIKDPAKPKQLAKTGTHHLKVASVSFHYPEAAQERYAVSDFSLTIRPGEKVGLVGYSGSGKTTLTKLLLRFMDVTEGHILLDDIDIRDLAQKDLRSVISYVPQEPLLFHRTVADNIAYAKPGASKKEIVKAAKTAYVDDFVSELPKGYETLVGERGVKLSGGQRQRVAIARALLKDSPILVLDEATSALDSKSEKYIQDGLRKLMKNRTSLVIAHRLSTIQRMDRIVVMDKGKIVQSGTHQELLKDKQGIYAKLWGHQSGGYIGTNSSAQQS